MDGLQPKSPSTKTSLCNYWRLQHSRYYYSSSMFWPTEAFSNTHALCHGLSQFWHSALRCNRGFQTAELQIKNKNAITSNKLYKKIILGFVCVFFMPDIYRVECIYVNITMCKYTYYNINLSSCSHKGTFYPCVFIFCGNFIFRFPNKYF